MDILAQLQRRVVEACDLSRAHPRPWLKHLLALQRARDSLCELTQRAATEPQALRDVGLTRRLKPSGDDREFAFVTVEVELALMAEAADLVWELDGPSRRPTSFATPVAFGPDPYWTVQSFAREQRGPNGAYARYRGAQDRLQSEAPFVALTDVERYFPSLNWSAIVGGLTYASGWERGDVIHAIGLLGRLRMALQGRHSGLPVGLDISYVLGNAVLAEIDDLAGNLAYRGLATRWLDDVAFGVESHLDGWNSLNEVAEGPLRALNLRMHPRKTDVVLASSWDRKQESFIYLDDVEAVHGSVLREITKLIRESGRAVPKARARGIVRALGELALDPEQEAEVLCDHAAELVLAAQEVNKRLRALVGEPLPTDLTDRVVASSLRTPPDSAWEGEVAEQLLELDRRRADLGKGARKHLLQMIGDRNRGERARVTSGWVLARRLGDHDRAVLDRLNEMSVPAARGAIASAHVAGAKLRNYHYLQAALAVA